MQQLRATTHRTGMLIGCTQISIPRYQKIIKFSPSELILFLHKSMQNSTYCSSLLLYECGDWIFLFCFFGTRVWGVDRAMSVSAVPPWFIDTVLKIIKINEWSSYLLHLFRRNKTYPKADICDCSKFAVHKYAKQARKNGLPEYQAFTTTYQLSLIRDEQYLNSLVLDQYACTVPDITRKTWELGSKNFVNI